jgi:signal peptidase I
MQSRSMEPTIVKGELVVCDSGMREPLRWDVVGYSYTYTNVELNLCARVVGLPGETIDISRGVLINGTNLVVPGALRRIVHLPGIPGLPVETIRYPFRVPTNAYFVLGDNSTNAFDSRYHGAVTMEKILGTVRGK